MKPRILLVNPPVYDFTAYDFWAKPLGVLSVAGWLRHAAHIGLFDYMDRLHPGAPAVRKRVDAWGRGHFHSEPAARPAALAEVRRRYHRFGVPRAAFRAFLSQVEPFDFALVQTGMTYWYPGVLEVIEDLRALAPAAKIVLGGVYATLANAHARTLGADLVVAGPELTALWEFLGITPELDAPPFWEGYERLQTGVLKLTDGCPFRCTYCSVPLVQPLFRPRPLAQSAAAFNALVARGVRDIAFYDDALLFRADTILLPFLQAARAAGAGVRFHTPNALNARFITSELAAELVAGGFTTFYLGFESASSSWQEATGGKVAREDLAAAASRLRAAGTPPERIHAYILLGHPHAETQALEDSIRFAHALGIRIMLADFAPIPGTPDGDACGRLVPLTEPLWHNKTAFTLRALGEGETNRLKQLCRDMNASTSA